MGRGQPKCHTWEAMFLVKTGEGGCAQGGGRNSITKCHIGREGSKNHPKSVTYYLNGPLSHVIHSLFPSFYELKKTFFFSLSYGLSFASSVSCFCPSILSQKWNFFQTNFFVFFRRPFLMVSIFDHDFCFTFDYNLTSN